MTTDNRVLAFLNPARMGVDAGKVYLQLTVPLGGQSAAVVTAPPPAPNPMRHLSYALQWLGMAIAFVVLVGLATRKTA